MKTLRLILTLTFLLCVIAITSSGAFAADDTDVSRANNGAWPAARFTAVTGAYITPSARIGFLRNPSSSIFAGGESYDVHALYDYYYNYAIFSDDPATAGVIPPAEQKQPGADGSAKVPSGLSEEQISERILELIESYIKEQADEPGITDEEAPDPVIPAEDAQPEDSVLLLITVTNPNGEETEIVYKNTFSICGVRDDDADPDEPIILYLTRYDSEAEAYAQYEDVSGESRWTVGSNGVFTRGVLLEEGENRFAIAACEARIIEAAQTEGQLIEEYDLQIVMFTIIYRSQSMAEKIGEIIKELTIANILKEIGNN